MSESHQRSSGQPPNERPAGHLDRAWPGSSRRASKQVAADRAHSPRHQHRPESSQLAGFQGSGMFEEGLAGEAETGVPGWAGSTIFGPPWSSVRCRAPAGRSRRESRGLAGDLFACSRPRGSSMPLYMYQASYTAKSMADQLKEPQDPVEVIRPALEELGATIVVAGF